MWKGWRNSHFRVPLVAILDRQVPLDIESVLGGLRLSYGEGMESVPYQTGLTFEAFPFI